MKIEFQINESIWQLFKLHLNWTEMRCTNMQTHCISNMFDFKRNVNHSVGLCLPQINCVFCSIAIDWENIQDLRLVDIAMKNTKGNSFI